MQTKLNLKQLLLASIIVFIIASLLTVLFVKLTVTDPDAVGIDVTMMMRVWNYLGRFIYSITFVYIFTRFAGDRSSIRAGLHYGLSITLLIIVPRMFWYLVSTQFGVDYVLTMALLGVVETILCGIAVALVYKMRPTLPG